MDKIYILCVDDQQEVLDSVVRDLRPLTPYIRIEEAASAADCKSLIEEIDEAGGLIAVVISDQVMPGESGVDLLRTSNDDRRFVKTRKVLLPGQATQSDTIRAVNEGHINYYFEKPWDTAKLLEVVKKLLTEYVLESGIDYREIMPVLDSNTILKKLH